MGKVNIHDPEAGDLWKILKTKENYLINEKVEEKEPELDDDLEDEKLDWTKFLINREGIPIQRFGPTDRPMHFLRLRCEMDHLFY